MTLAIPPDVIFQAVIALLAGLVATTLGVAVMHLAWHHHDLRAERDFLVGMCVHIVGLSWVVLAGAIILGSFATDGTSQAAQIQEVVVFTNAATRIALLLIGTHLLWHVWRGWRAKR